jgi:ADP-ribose pyrophosphatase YjhB (NUDIX family)
VKALLARVYGVIPPAFVRALLAFLHPSFSVSVVGAFFAPDGRVLLLRHVYRHSYPWGLPSGFLAAGETPETGVLRELKEETGMSARTERVISVTPIARRHLEVLILGVVDPAQPVVISHEIFEAGFFFTHDLPAAMPPAHRALVQQLANSRAGS